MTPGGLLRAAAATAVAAAALVASAAGAAAADTAVDLETDAAKAWFRTDHYGIFVDGRRVGWMRRALAQVEFGGVPAVAREVEVHLDVAGDGNGVSNSTRTVFTAGGEQTLVFARTQTSQQSRASWREVTRRGGRFDVVTSARGERTEGAVKAVDLTLADDLAFERIALIASERADGAVGTKLDVGSFDVGHLVGGRRRLEVVKASGEGATRVFDVKVRVGPIDEDAAVEASGAVVSGTLGARFTYRREPAEIAKEPELRSSLEALSRVPLDAGLGDVRKIRRLVLAWDRGIPGAIAVGGRQSVEAFPDRVQLTVRRDGPTPGAGDQAIEAALAREPGLDVGDPQITRLVTHELSGTSLRGPQVAKLLALTARALEKTVVLGTPSALEILQTRRGDCTEHVRLFTSLCRTAGIPCRSVTGLAWMGDETGAFGWHEWAEVELGRRWIAVDPTSGANPAPATNLALLDTQEVRAALWGAKFRLVKAEHDGDPPSAPEPTQPADPKAPDDPK